MRETEPPGGVPVSGRCCRRRAPPAAGRAGPAHRRTNGTGAARPQPVYRRSSGRGCWSPKALRTARWGTMYAPYSCGVSDCAHESGAAPVRGAAGRHPGGVVGMPAGNCGRGAARCRRGSGSRTGRVGSRQHFGVACSARSGGHGCRHEALQHGRVAGVARVRGAGEGGGGQLQQVLGCDGGVMAVPADLGGIRGSTTGAVGTPSHTTTSTVRAVRRSSISTGSGAYFRVLVTNSLTTSRVSPLPCEYGHLVVACGLVEEVGGVLAGFGDAAAAAQGVARAHQVVAQPLRPLSASDPDDLALAPLSPASTTPLGCACRSGGHITLPAGTRVRPGGARTESTARPLLRPRSRLGSAVDDAGGWLRVAGAQPSVLGANRMGAGCCRSAGAAAVPPAAPGRPAVAKAPRAGPTR